MSGERRSWGKVRRLPSGRFQASYIGPDRERHVASVTFTAETDAAGWLRDERHLIEYGDWVSPAERAEASRVKGVTLETYAREWLADRTLKPRTRVHYDALLDRLILPTLGKVPLRAITPATVRTWHAGMGTGTPTQRAHAYGLLRTILGSAVDDEHLKVNPAHIRGAGTAKRAHHIQPATLAELAAITTNMPPKYRLMVLLAAWCALRFGELTELRRRDVDLTGGTLRIRRGVVRVHHEGSVSFVVGTPKTTAGSRDVAIPPHLIPVIREHLREHVAPGRDSLLFPNSDGGHLAPSTLYGKEPTRTKNDAGETVYTGGTNYYRARAAAGRPDLRWHDLRHTGAVLAASTGATLAELMARLGHSTAGAAMRYQHAAQDRDKAIAEALSKLATMGER